jgi:serine/threonine protein kinase
MIGKVLAQYQISEKLGEGGMGVVWKARDTHLDRFVALKTLSAERLADPERKRRFVQEAKAASALNHPNIVHIYDIADADGIQFIAMEYVAGKTLDQLIGRKGLRLNEVLKYAAQIADALARAHAAGIIHRDLKPSNLMIDDHGLVKVLDFGLAKLAETATSEFGETATLRAPEGPSTEEGTIVGTTAYMSPEQAEGKKVDARSDIFSFGSVLYETVTGRRAFHGDSKLSTLSAILKDDPKGVSEVAPDVPRDLEKIIGRCLRKDPERRWQAMADLKVALEELKEESDSGNLLAPATMVPARGPKWRVIGLSAAALILAAAGAFWWYPRPSKPAERTLTRLTSNGSSFSPAISPDGKMLAYVSATSGPDPEIWVEQMGGGKAIQITHQPGGAFDPVFSPDGTHIAFDTRDGIYEIPALGGEPRSVAPGFTPQYSPDGLRIMFLNQEFALCIVPRSGGTSAVIQPGLTLFSGLRASPDGRSVVAVGYRKGKQDQDLTRWWLISIPDGKMQAIPPPPPLPNQGQVSTPEVWGQSAHDSRRQWVIFSRPMGDSFNLFRIAVSSEGKMLSDAEQITFTTGTAAGGSVSETGRMVFGSGTVSTDLWSIPVDADGGRVTGERQRLSQTEGTAEQYSSLSRDGKKAAFLSGINITVKDLGSGQETPLAVGIGPSISPDGSSVVYFVLEGEKTSFYTISTAGGTPRKVCQDCAECGPKGFSSDGSRVLAQHGCRSGGLDRIELIHIATGEAKDVLSHPKHHLWHPYFSWDDRWMTFKFEVAPSHSQLYITPVENFIPAGESRWIPLTAGTYYDDKPQLSPDGNILYFNSNRDGFNCFWGQRLNPKTKHPMGAPFAIQHIHNQRLIPGTDNPLNRMEISVARDKIVTNLEEFRSDIWMMQLEPAK